MGMPTNQEQNSPLPSALQALNCSKYQKKISVDTSFVKFSFFLKKPHPKQAIYVLFNVGIIFISEIEKLYVNMASSHWALIWQKKKKNRGRIQG